MSTLNVLNKKSPLPSPSVFEENKELTSKVDGDKNATVKLPASTATDLIEKSEHALNDITDVVEDAKKQLPASLARSRANSNAPSPSPAPP